MPALMAIVCSLCLCLAQSALADEPLKPTITDAGPHHWVSEGDPYGDTLADPARIDKLAACFRREFHQTYSTVSYAEAGDLARS